MSNYKTVFFILGFYKLFRLSMIVPIMAQFYYDQIDSDLLDQDWCQLFGVLFFLSNLIMKKLSLPQAFLLTALSC